MLKKIISNIPNTITCLSLVCGCIAVIMSFNYDSVYCGGLKGYEWAFILIGIAAVCDFFDGAAARALHAYSALGKELDSLSDLVSFGVAPGMLIYNTLQIYASHTWISYLAILIPVMGELRLARFNIDDRQTTSFLGLPIPANAIFWIGACAAIHPLRVSRRQHHDGASHSCAPPYGNDRTEDVLIEIQEFQAARKFPTLPYHCRGYIVCGAYRNFGICMDNTRLHTALAYPRLTRQIKLRPGGSTTFSNLLR